jgi:hypothetical protein
VSARLARAALVVAACAAASAASGQTPPPKEKDKPKAAKPPARSFTDEDLKKYRPPPTEGTTEPAPSGGASSPSTPSSSSSARERESEPPRTEPDPRSAIEREGGNSESDGRSPEEASWRARAREARRPLREAQERLAGLEEAMTNLRDQLNPMSTRYVLGGNSNAGPGKVLEVQDQINKLEPEIETAKGLIADAEKEWTKFLADARAAGANPNWLNP